MKLNELKKAKPATKKSSGTDDPDKYVGGWETYDEPQGINDRQDPKVLAKESNLYFPDADNTSRWAPEDTGPNLVLDPTDQKEIKASRKAPKKAVRANVKAMSARGKPAQLNPYRLDETIRTPFLGTLNAEYEIVNEEDHSIGYARVEEGVISTLDYLTESDREYRSKILSALMHQIVTEADFNTANLSIQVQGLTGEVKSLLERFGFRRVGGTVMRRGAGSIRPTSVPAPQGMINRTD